MKISYFPNNTALNGSSILDAFLQGCHQLGITTVEQDLNADAAVIWSMLWAGRMRHNQAVWKHYRSLGRPVIVLEVGGIKRGVTWRMGLNGVNREANFGPRHNDGGRAKQLGMFLKDWRKNGSAVMVCTQRHESHQWRDMPHPFVWLDQTIKSLREYTSRPIIIRPHPRQTIKGSWPGVTLQKPEKIIGTYDCFDFDPVMQEAWAVINYNSNPGPQSIINGIPAFVGAESLAAPVANLDLSDIENPKMPDRQQWLNDLAYCEWTREEIATGMPLRRLLYQC